MGVIATIAGKDLKLLWRDRAGLFFVLVFPLIYALFFGAIFGRGGDGDGGSKIAVALVDEDGSETSRAFAARLRASSAIRLEPMALSPAREAVRKGDKTAFVHLPPGFGGGDAPFGMPDEPPRVVTDPSRSAERGMLQGVLMEAIFAPFQEVFRSPDEMRKQARRQLQVLREAEDVPAGIKLALAALMQALASFADSVDQAGAKLADSGPLGGGEWVVFEDLTRERQFGFESSYEITFPSSILWGILGCAAGFAITLVRERSSGTLQRLRVAPIGRAEILAGKGLACFLSCVAVIALLFGFGAVVFGVRVLDPFHLLLATVSTALCFVGIMMAISTIGRTEQSVAGAGWAIFVVMAMVGGGMVPLFILPDWIVTISHFSPVKWGIYALEGAIWRDFSLLEMLAPCGILVAIGAVCFAIGTWRMPRLEA